MTLRFAEEIKNAIEESEMTLLSLSDASGLSVDHISKMRRGVRLPQDTEKVQKLVMALQRSEEESKRLMTLYRIERMGDEEWRCMKGIQQLLEYGNKLTVSSEIKMYASEAENGEWNTDMKILYNRSDVFSFLQKMLPGTRGTVRMLAEEVPQTIVDLLALHLQREDFYCEHLFSLKPLREKSGSLYNICYVNQIMPLICSGKNYLPCYDYEKKGDAFLPNWLISDRWAIGLQKDMDGGIIEWDAKKIAWIREQYEKRKKNKRQLLLYFSDISQWGQWIMEKRRQYRAEAISGCIRPHDVKNHYIEYEPCTMMHITEEMLQKHILLPEAEKAEVIALFKARREQEMYAECAKFFTKKGAERFAKTGRISQFPDIIYTPLTITERIQLLQDFLEWVQSSDRNLYMLDERQINLSYRTFVFSTVSLVHNEFVLMIGRKGAEYVSICEQGISEKLTKFCQMLESGEMICSKEECVKAIKEVLAKLEAMEESEK